MRVDSAAPDKKVAARKKHETGRIEKGVEVRENGIKISHAVY
jgi:hypothetical protein